MKRTISVMTGAGSLNHNDRKFTAQNVDKERTENNITYCNENIRNVYHKLFDEAVKKYNAKQTRKDRIIKNYYKKISLESKQEKPFAEIIIQIGDKDNMGAETENGQLAKEILDKYMKGFQDRNPNLYVFSAHLHMDEATPHLHIDFVPFTTGSKRGLETRVSLKKALESQGFSGGSRSDTELNQWRNSEKDVLANVMLEYGIERKDKGTHEKHKSVSEFKRDKLIEEVEMLEDKKQELESDISKYKNAEEYALVTARKLEDEALKIPEPAALMSAKKYRNDSVMPFVNKLIKIIKTLARRVFTAEKNAEKLSVQAKTLLADNERLKKLNWDKNFELSKCNVEIRKFDKIKNYFGLSQVEEWLKRIDKERKLSKKVQKEKQIITLMILTGM